MRARLHVIAFVAFLVVLLFDVCVWGAAARLPEVGPRIAESAARETFLAQTYIVLGSPLQAVGPLETVGRAIAEDAFSPAFADIAEDPRVAMARLLGPAMNGTHGTVKSLYWGAPILLALWAVLYALRPRAVHMIGGGRRR